MDNARDTFLFLFDFDGVFITNTNETLEKHQRIARSLRLPVPTLEMLKSLWGKPWESVIIPTIADKLGWSAKDQALFISTINDEKNAIGETAVPEVAEMLEKLKQKGHYLAIISSREKSTLTGKVAKIGINPEVFDWIQSCDDSEHIKPDARVFSAVLKKLHDSKIEIAKIFYTGDMIEYDYRAVQNCLDPASHIDEAMSRYLHEPIEFIGVSGMHAKEEFMALGLHEDSVIASLHELPKALKLHGITI